MTKDDVAQRAVALVQQAIDVLLRLNDAPASPVSTLAPAKARQQMRRSAERLRAGVFQPKYKNLHTSEELAGILERTARRDEIFEWAVKDFRKIMSELGPVLEEDRPAAEAAIEELKREMERAAKEHGPHSEAAQRYERMLFFEWMRRQSRTDRRRQKRRPDPGKFSLAAAPSVEARYTASAAELLASPPAPGEPVVAIPPEGSGSGRERIFIRIGVDASSWTGSFERGNQGLTSVAMMPDGKHLFVSAHGAGYVIEAASRTLVETIGMDVVRVIGDKPTLFVVDHGGRSLEAFGRTGRLWKVDRLSSGGFRGLRLGKDVLAGEAWQWWRGAWVGFAVHVPTGAVRLER